MQTRGLLGDCVLSSESQSKGTIDQMWLDLEHIWYIRSQLCVPSWLLFDAFNISISAWRQKRNNVFFQKVSSIWGKIVLFLVIVLLYFLWKRIHKLLYSTISITNKHLKPICAILAQCSTEEPQLRQGFGAYVPRHKTHFPYLSEKQVGNLGKPTIFVSCGCSWGLRRWLGTEEDWAPAAPVLSKHTLVEASKFRPLGRWGWNNWSDPDLGLVREATKQMRNGYEAEIRAKLDSAAASFLLLHALVLSVLASTYFCN